MFLSKQETEAILSVIVLNLLLFGVTVISWVKYITELIQVYLELAVGKPCSAMALDIWLSNEMWTREHLIRLAVNVTAALLCLVVVYLDYRLFQQNYQVIRHHHRHNQRQKKMY